MKALMSEKLKQALSDPQKNRALQLELTKRINIEDLNPPTNTDDYSYNPISINFEHGTTSKVVASFVSLKTFSK